MALSGHIREMKMVGLLVPVDSRFRGNDGVGLPSIFIAITMALSGHIREMKMVGLLVPVDSRFRGNDGVGLPSIFIAMTVGVFGMTVWGRTE